LANRDEILNNLWTLLRCKAGDNSMEPVAVTGRIEPLPIIIDEGVGYCGGRTCERKVD
jgi:hypothetical protein